MIMKKFIFTLILLSGITIYADGQTDNKHFSYTTYIGTGLSMSQPSRTPFTWQIIGHYHINQRLTIGAADFPSMRKLLSHYMPMHSFSSSAPKSWLRTWNVTLEERFPLPQKQTEDSTFRHVQEHN